jgi:Zn-finger nucleic acid-binding protein
MHCHAPAESRRARLHNGVARPAWPGGLQTHLLYRSINPAMPTCPDCASELRTMKQEGGLFFLCDQCGGRAATIPQVRRAVGERYVALLLHEINHATSVTSRKCPFCALPMREFRNLETALVLDTCKRCSVVWFDAREFEQASEIGKRSAQRCDRPRAAGGGRTSGSGSADTLTVEVLKSLATFLCLPF